MPQATLSSKNQIVIPKEGRDALRVKAGDKLLVVVRDDRVIVLKKPNAHHAAIRGIGEGVYPADHLRKERKGWATSLQAFPRRHRRIALDTRLV